MKVTLTNRLSASAAHGQPSSARVGIQAAGVVADVRRTGGAKVGFNDDPTVGIGGSITYYWRVPAQEGLFLFQDMAAPAGGEHDAGHGASGCTAPSPSSRPARCGPTRAAAPSCRAPRASPPRPTRRRGTRAASSTWRLTSTHRAHRRSARACSWPRTRSRASAWASTTAPSRCPPARRRRAPTASARRPGSRPGRTATLPSSSSRADPGRGCRPPTADRKESENCGLAESCYVSNVMHTYTGDATKIRFGLAGVKETHVFHLHAHQWLADPRGDAVTGRGARRQARVHDHRLAELRAG